MINSQLSQTMPQYLCSQHQLPLQYLNLDQKAQQQTMCQHCPHIGKVIHVETFQNILNESEQVIQNTINQLSLMFKGYKTEIHQYLKNIEIEFEKHLQNLNIIRYLENEIKEITNIHSLNTIILLISSQMGQNNLINYDKKQYEHCLQMIAQLEILVKHMKNEQNNIPKKPPFSSYQKYEHQSKGLEISILNFNQQGNAIVWVTKNSIRYPTINIFQVLKQRRRIQKFVIKFQNKLLILFWSIQKSKMNDSIQIYIQVYYIVQFQKYKKIQFLRLLPKYLEQLSIILERNYIYIIIDNFQLRYVPHQFLCHIQLLIFIIQTICKNKHYIDSNSQQYLKSNSRILTKLSNLEQYNYESLSLYEDNANYIEFHPKKKIFLLNNYIYGYLENINKWEKRQSFSSKQAILGKFNCDGSLFGLVNNSNQITILTFLQLSQEQIAITNGLNVNKQILNMCFDKQSNLLVLLSGILMVYNYQNGLKLNFQIKLNEDIYNLQCYTTNEKQFYIYIANQTICICASTFAIIDSVSVGDTKIINICFNEKQNKLFVCDNLGKIRIYELRQNLTLNLIQEDPKLCNIKDISLIRFCQGSNQFVVVDKKMKIHLMSLLD